MIYAKRCLTIDVAIRDQCVAAVATGANHCHTQTMEGRRNGNSHRHNHRPGSAITRLGAVRIELDGFILDSNFQNGFRRVEAIKAPLVCKPDVDRITVISSVASKRP